ncbi:threonine-phosphate decarboxylase [Corynebacterium aquilae DSM 44791]|uniref:Cobalamin biosynthesis protein CobD n=1 Tax=Corynebacterium aquilae DSM 44791 TaxID=1431546 RepID=A0A1L7CH54_9CORY|nr:threonine-phosphate decarboxylase [Corynebacterium aquilae DSM 44791]
MAAGVLADRLIADPSRHHPVAWFGTYATKVEKRLYRDSFSAGLAYLAATTIPPMAASLLISRAWPNLSLIPALWAAIGARTLENTGANMKKALDEHDIDTARSWVPWLCSRDPQLLDEVGMARATVESLAENTSDATIAPIVWAAILGTPGVVLHRTVNTLDAMVGYRNDTYRHFGTAAARCDDLLAWLPARITACYHLGYAYLVGRGTHSQNAWRTQASRHPSPNAGPVEATAAGALGVTLGGKTVYAHGVEHRPELGYGPAPTTNTIADAITLARFTEGCATLDAMTAVILIGFIRDLLN